MAITDDVKAEIIALGERHLRATVIARAVRQPIASVRAVLREANLLRKGASRGPAPKSKAAKAAALVASGELSVADAAAKVRVSRQAVHEYIKRHGLPIVVVATGAT